MRMLSFLVLLCSSAATCFRHVPGPAVHPLRSPKASRAPLAAVAARAATEQDSEQQLKEELEVWRLREGMIRGAYGVLVNWKEEDREEAELGGRDAEDTGRTAFVASAGAVLVGALVLRLGGRAALVSVLGLDVVSDMGIGDAIDDVIAYANALGPLAVVGFLGAWVVAKVFLVDVISIALALSSGILFGGVFPGALLATTGATIGSLCAFQLSRGVAQPRVSSAVQSQPVARALAKVVEEDGFKTVFVLRLAPILPIPLGAYSYIYGASNLSWVPVAAGTFLGGIKPYLIDSYLGVFAKQMIDGDAMDSSKDIILLVGLGVLVLVGVFATELAGESWDQVQAEVKLDEQRRKELKDAGISQDDDGDAEGGGWQLGAKAAALIPASWKEEADEVWANLGAFADHQWEPTLRQVVTSRRRRAEEELAGARIMPGADSDNPIERLLASLATPAETEAEAAAKAEAKAAAKAEAKAEAMPAKDGAATEEGAPSAAAFFYGDDKASPADLEERRKRADWAIEGSLGRTALTSLFFTFALADAAKRRWSDYPEDEEELERLLESGTPAGGDLKEAVAAASEGSSTAIP